MTRAPRLPGGVLLMISNSDPASARRAVLHSAASNRTARSCSWTLKCVDAIDSGAPRIEVWGTGSASREFLYVEDCARAIVLAARHYDGGEPVNLGAGREITIRDLVGLVARLTGFRGEIVWDPSKPDGQPRRCLDTSRALAEFGWRARTPLRDGLRETIHWFESNVEFAMRP